jgi:glucose-1-phosphate cytidylyltransferase
MKAVILAGGYGTRLTEESAVRPKPMVEIGAYPILWHIMKTYSFYGINDFVICLGYKGYMIKEYFRNYALHMSDVTIDLARDRMEVHCSQAEPWRVTLIDTGEGTLTGGRLKRVGAYLGGSCNETDVSARLTVHVALATRADYMLVKPGFGIDEGLMLMRNEMLRTLKVLTGARNSGG